VVEDGSRDDTAEILRRLDVPGLVPVYQPGNGGKYAAVKAGVAISRGRSVVMTDADLPYEFEAIPYFVATVTAGRSHVAIGDRTLPGSVYAAKMPFLRRLANRMFAWFIQHLLASGIHDSQCGLKAFRGDVGRALFAVMREPGFIGDVELLYVALKYNFSIRRIPVRLRFQGESTVSAVSDGLGMVARLPGIWLRWRRGQYESATLRELARQDYCNQPADAPTPHQGPPAHA